MQFRLIYSGPLKAEGRNDGRAREKHEIRRTIRPQLAELWNTHPFLKRFMEAHVKSERIKLDVSAPTLEELREKMVVTEYDSFTVAQKMAKRFSHKGYNFLPLVGDNIFAGVRAACALDILFLRRDDPGRLVKSGGDIDNRIKVLFDALKMPKLGEFEPASAPYADEDPFFCLLQDDSLINEIRVSTDRLLTPLADGEHVNNVQLIINVKTVLMSGNSGDGGASAAFTT